MDKMLHGGEESSAKETKINREDLVQIFFSQVIGMFGSFSFLQAYINIERIMEDIMLLTSKIFIL